MRGITVTGPTGTHAYLDLLDIEVSTSKPPVARVELEIKQGNGIKRNMRKLRRNDNLYDLIVRSSGTDKPETLIVPRSIALTHKAVVHLVDFNLWPVG